MFNRLKNFFSSSVGQIFLAAFFLRVFLAPLFFHPDTKTNYYNSHFLSLGVVNIYEFLAKNPDKAFLGEFSYPPLTYFFYGLLYYPLKVVLGPDFLNWLAMGNDAVAVPNIFRYLFFMKVPLFFFEFFVGFLITKILKDEKEIKRALLFWFFNPANIYAITFMGQFDIIPTFLSVLALYLVVNKRKAILGAIALGLGGALKTYPLLLLPFLSVISTKGIWKQFKVFILGLFPYLLFVLPFLKSVSFRQSSFVSGLSQRLFILNLSIGFEEQILLVIFSLVLLFLIADWKKEVGESLSGYFLAVPLIVLAGSHFHPQWLIWITPFLALSVGKCKKLLLPSAILLTGWLGTVVLFNDKFLTWGLFSPFDPGIFFLPPLRDLIADFFSPVLLQSLFHTLFAACAIWISILVITGKLNEKS
ncbi:hypothetical protein COS55_00200 [Candidatus Shapirobacteria bacterium CG03_land_8_20_14_0_80_40_19]|uniref:Glycosyltransferase RgtA/B/C/D-like domain-containing protein n=3 Tax=Candidatus Shapironibacteriota TaxID=1752721 RepID=A0A2M7BGF3_9BACT|nr:MAG: hypothetical protein COV89_00100 [Candidatus Shapirobacteria bacterium CG11_big_fil_rev_8_21_14_0_20_40_12]PIV02178.1 MAG: hypothetical protein COS55_00200 [Candidatus Shapirobacteria bacterium CG03_land_8_20_14_0_80_40_19]PJC77493.1 MAG: hypothetical protein CO010_00415 [Candidatus Shapirobacteria bacterium CG_4_8_14_3_um_filter_39_11]